jgi:hypothetical protein
MTIKVKVSSYNSKIKATVASGVIMARTLNELLDVNVTNVKDKYLLMYDAVTQKYTAVNPDEVLSATVTEVTSPGLPSNFKNQLDSDLDNKIDLDGGTF